MIANYVVYLYIYVDFELGHIIYSLNEISYRAHVICTINKLYQVLTKLNYLTP